MRKIYISALLGVGLCISANAQKVVYELNFENLDIGTEITKGKLKFQGWNKSVWTVQKDDNNKFGVSTDQKKVFLIKSFDVTPGNRYRWTLETKVVNNGPAWKRTHILSVFSGKGEESQQLAKESIAEPKNGTWASSSLDFTVPQNKSEVTLQLFRFADGATVSVDNYKLVKL
jgi:hypothetical protein